MLQTSEQLEHLKLAAEVAGLEVGRFTLPEDHDVVVNRMRFHYLDWGAAGRHPILLLHGGGSTRYVGSRMPGAPRRVSLHRAGPARPWRQRMVAGRRLQLPSQVRRHRALHRKARPRTPAGGRPFDGGFAAMAYAAKFARRMAGLVLVDIAPELNPSGTARIGNFLAQDRELDSVDAFVERAMAFNPLRNPALLRRSLLHNLREFAQRQVDLEARSPIASAPRPSHCARARSRS